MPLWIIYHPPTTFTTSESKGSLAQAITDIYTAASLPAFYVNVLFQPIEPSSFYISAVARPSPKPEVKQLGPDSSKPFIRVTIQNIARSLPDHAARDRFLDSVDAALKPHIEDQGYDWEYSVMETNRDLWKVQGLVPPKSHTKAEKEWERLNQAVPFEKADGGL